MERVNEKRVRRELVDQFKINNREIEADIVKAMTAKVYDVDIAPGIELVGPLAEPMQRGSILTVYRKGARRP